jgi:rhamnosyltransferase
VILGVVVTYNPNLLDLIENLRFINSQVDKLVVFDNASINQEQIRNILSKESIEILSSNRNVGLGAAYNKVIELHIGKFDFLITFDQDTKIPQDLVANLMRLFSISDVGVVGPNFEMKKSSFSSYRDVHVLIQSACIFRMSLFDEIGGFNEKYFIDSVDFEFCLRVKKKGYRVLMSNVDYIKHELGVKKNMSFFSIITHSSIRNFYIARNHVNLSLRYFRYFPFFIIKKNIFFVIHFFKLLFFDRNIKSIHNFISGFFKGFKEI